ncbi:TolC family protein [Pseudomonas sp. SDO5271_S396]
MTYTHDRRPTPSAQGTAAPAFRLSLLATLVCGLSMGLSGASVQADEFLAFLAASPAKAAPAPARAAPAVAAPRRTEVVMFKPAPAAVYTPPAAPVVRTVPVVAEPRRVEVVAFKPEPTPPVVRAVQPVVEPRRVEVVAFKPEPTPPVVRAVQPVVEPRRAEVVTFKPAVATVSPPPARAASSRSENLSFSRVDADSVAKPVPRAPSTVNVAPSRSGELPGVSALATLGVSESVAMRQVTAVGPSERELREILQRAVQAAAERSPKVQAAVAEQSAADADIDEAKGQRWPQVDLSTTAGSKKFGGSSDDQSSGGTGINLSIVTPVYDWGRIRSTIESRRHLSAAAASAIEAELENSAFDVTNRIVELGKQRLIVDLSQQYVDRMNELVKMLAGIVAVDKGRASELTQAKSRMLQAQAARDAADTKAKDAEISLRKLVGDRPIAIPRTPQWNIRLANLDALLGKVDNHPSLNQAREQTESAELQAKVVRASSLPQLNWVINKSTAEDSLGREQPWETHLALSWGAFRGGSTRASERAALQRAEAGRQTAEQQRLDLEYGIRTANHEARTFLERAELYRSLTNESDGIRVAFYEQWYHLGKRTLLDVLSAESDHYGNRVSEISNRFDGYQAILRQYAGAGALGAWLRGEAR